MSAGDLRAAWANRTDPASEMAGAIADVRRRLAVLERGDGLQRSANGIYLPTSSGPYGAGTTELVDMRLPIFIPDDDSAVVEVLVDCMGLTNGAQPAGASAQLVVAFGLAATAGIPLTNIASLSGFGGGLGFSLGSVGYNGPGNPAPVWYGIAVGHWRGSSVGLVPGQTIARFFTQGVNAPSFTLSKRLGRIRIA